MGHPSTIKLVMAFLPMTLFLIVMAVVAYFDRRRREPSVAVQPMQTPSIIDHPSPNFGNRSVDEPSIIVLHYTSMDTWQAALDRLCDPKFEVSSHYLVTEEGVIYRLVQEDKRAWHAGASSWRNVRDVNSASIGIEIANQGDRPFTKPQMAAVSTLCQWIRSRYDIPQQNVIGHSDVAPGRKPDPGWFFDWKGLAADGVGIIPTPEAQDYQRSANWGDSDIRHALTQYGWTTSVDRKTVLEAFQRHFQQEVSQSPDKIGIADKETAARLAWLVRHK
jgi:N-acetylmuramoyl-L-alanine amidase